MTDKTYTGRNLDVAIKKAVAGEGVSADSLRYEVLAGASGGFALIRMLEATGAPALSEALSGAAVADGAVDLTSVPAAPAAGDDDRPRAGRDDRGPRDDRGARDDRGGRGGRGGRSDRGDRGDGRGRDDRGGRGGRGRDDREGGRGRPGADLPPVPTDGPTEVVMRVADGVALSEIGEDAHEVLRDILSGMGFGVTVDMVEQDDSIVFDLKTDVYAKALVANNLELVDAIEHLLDKIVNFDSDERKNITVDVEGTKTSADLDLAKSALELAERAVETGQTLKLGPLDPRSRRVVHVALQDRQDVVTKSEGEGAFRRVCIIPSASANAGRADD